MIALLHQHQRQVKAAAVQGRTVEYIEATLADIERANAWRTKCWAAAWTVPPQTRRVLAGVVTLVAALMQAQGAQRADVRFTRAGSAHTGLSDTQCRVHLDRLTELEYLLSHRGQRGQSYEYELLHDAAADRAGPHLAGLIDVAALQCTPTVMATTASSRGVNGVVAGPTRPQNGLNAGPSRAPKTPQRQH